MIYSLLLIAFLNSDFELAGKTSSGLILCERLNTEVSSEKLQEYSNTDRKLNSYIELELEKDSVLSHSFFNAQVDYIDSFANIDKNKSLDQQLLSIEQCQVHLDNANKLIDIFKK
ncbi:MAG: hypothetical protein ACTH5C_17190 [Pseudoalteromonas prydzensis]|uniref:hypothetical protein n=1 Tax=Pseudoalteromonas prydzensis TaxID=182141 RepID=UPI003F964827